MPLDVYVEEGDFHLYFSLSGEAWGQREGSGDTLKVGNGKRTGDARSREESGKGSNPAAAHPNLRFSSPATS